MVQDKTDILTNIDYVYVEKWYTETLRKVFDSFGLNGFTLYLVHQRGLIFKVMNSWLSSHGYESEDKEEERLKYSGRSQLFS